MRAFGTMVAHPGELMLSPEETGSPRRVGSFNPKKFGAQASQRLAWASQGPENCLK